MKELLGEKNEKGGVHKWRWNGDAMRQNKNDEEKNIVVLSTEALPATVDWRTKGAVNAV